MENLNNINRDKNGNPINPEDEIATQGVDTQGIAAQGVDPIGGQVTSVTSEFIDPNDIDPINQADIQQGGQIIDPISSSNKLRDSAASNDELINPNAEINPVNEDDLVANQDAPLEADKRNNANNSTEQDSNNQDSQNQNPQDIDSLIDDFKQPKVEAPSISAGAHGHITSVQDAVEHAAKEAANNSMSGSSNKDTTALQQDALDAAKQQETKVTSELQKYKDALNSLPDAERIQLLQVLSAGVESGRVSNIDAGKLPSVASSPTFKPSDQSNSDNGRY